jgi:hypothetical protein
MEKPKRILEPRPITFRCEWCGAESTEMRMPGPTPRYHTECKQPAQNSIAASRMRDMRQRKADQNPFAPKRPRGRPPGSIKNQVT